MKKIFLIIAIITCLVNANAQNRNATTKKNPLRIGFLLEPNIGWLHPNENGVTSDGGKVGINYGLMADYEFSENYFFSTGLQITHIGGKLQYIGSKTGYVTPDPSMPPSANPSTANYSISIQYIQIPFAIKLKSANKREMNYWGSFGGFIGVPLKARADVRTNFAVNGTNNFSVDNDNVIGKVQPINIGMQIGAGVEFPLGEKNYLVTGLIFNNGLIDVTKNGSWGDDGRMNLNNITLKLGVFF